MSGAASGSAVTRLDFKDKLLEKGKRDTGEVLLRKLKTLHTKLSALEQDHVEVASLDPVKRPLVDNLILHHKDKGIRAYAACCLADLLRLYAPDAPYNANELRDIFQFFSAQLSEHLRVSPTARPLQASRSKTNGAQAQESQNQSSQRITDVAYYIEYCYLLESLATIKSVVLACDVPGGDDIVTSFFEGFVKIVRSDMSKTVTRHMSQILMALLEESATVPQGVMDVIIDQFTNHARLDIPSFSMIVDVCNGSATRLQRPVYAHFADVQLTHGRNPTSEDMKAITESHALLLTIWNFSPDLLPMVIPILEENLRAADQVELRNLTTRTLARMFGRRPRVGMTVADLAKAFSGTWKAWLGRQLDKSVQVRLTWAESSIEILANVPDLRRELEDALVDRIQDSNEQVRAAICKVFGELDFETTLHQIRVNTLKAIGDRMSDKKAIVRNEAVSTLSKLWDAARTEIDGGEEQDEAVIHFAWIPQAIFHCLQIKDLPVDGRTALTSALKTRILPLPSKPDDEQEWVERLLLVASRLDDPGMAGLAKATGLPGYARGSSPYKAFVAFCEDNNGGIIDKDEELVKARLTFVINAIATTLFSDAEKAKKDMQDFAIANDNRLYKLLKTCTDPLTDLRALVKAKNEFLRRIEQQHTNLLETFTTIIENGSFNVVNTTSVSHLLKAIQSATGPRREQVAAAAFKLLALIAKECPPMYAAHVPELLVCIGQKKNDRLVEVALQSLAAACKYDRELAPKDSKNVDKVIQIALNGTPRQAKFAARFLAVCGHEHAPARLVDNILDQLAEKNQDLLLTHLRGLTELALSSPPAIEAKADEIHRFVTTEVIYKRSDSSDDNADDEWTDEENLSVIDRAKLVALRFVTHRAIGFARDPEALKVVNPVFSLLNGILRNEGQITQSTKEGGHAKTQIRLRTALCLIKLAQVRSFDKRMTRFFEPISYIMQDPCYQVRNRLLIKLAEVLPAQRMLARWNVMPAMIAADPEKDNPALAKSIITSCIKSCTHIPSAERVERIEMPLSRLLLVLAHHPDLDGWTVGTLKDMAVYIDLYLDCVINRDNAGLLYHVAGKVKSVKGLDANGEPDEDNTNLYKLAELTQIIIKNKAELHKWSIQTYPGKVKLPRDIFHNLQNTQVTVENTRRSYLTEEESAWAKGLGKRSNAAAGPSRRLAEPGSSPVRKRTKSGKPAGRKRSRRTNETSDEEDEEEDDDDGDDEEEEADDSMDSEESGGEGPEGEEVVGRGGKRGAKTKAKKGLKAKKKVKSGTKKRRSTSASAEAMDVDEESALSDAPGE